MKLEAAKKYQSWIFQHDNAPAHTSMLVGVFLGKNKTINMPQPPYSPDLVPADRLKEAAIWMKLFSIINQKNSNKKEIWENIQ